MKLKLRNKHLMAIHSLLVEAEKKGGIPYELDMDPEESLSFLKEIIYFQSKDSKLLETLDITYAPMETGNPDPRFLFRQNPPTMDTLKQLLMFWVSKKITFTYKYKQNSINIRPVSKQKTTKPTTEKPTVAK